MDENLTIGKLAKASGVGVETVRFYENKDLIKRPTKKTGSYRTYDTDDPGRIRFIKRAQELGFKLSEIRDLLDLNNSPKATCSDVGRKTKLKIQEVEAKIVDLKRMKKSLTELAEACGESKQALAECKILNCFESGWKC